MRLSLAGCLGLVLCPPSGQSIHFRELGSISMLGGRFSSLLVWPSNLGPFADARFFKSILRRKKREEKLTNKPKQQAALSGYGGKTGLGNGYSLLLPYEALRDLDD